MALHRWSVDHRSEFWEAVLDRLGIDFATAPRAILEGSAQHPVWLPGARLNVAAAALRGRPDALAIIAAAGGHTITLTRAELAGAAGRFAAGFHRAGYRKGDRVAIAMVMNVESVIAYLGTVLAGGVVVSIADSFSSAEIATRLRLTDPVAVVTQDTLARSGRALPMYEKVTAAGAARCIVVDTGGEVALRSDDMTWAAFMAEDEAEPTVCAAADHTNILFSSGTTGDPKAIPWNHLTPLKAAMDGHFHQDIHAGDVVAWPTNLGWMMGPWLIYAALVNGASLALYDDAPVGRGFTRFVADAGVTVLGLVPSMVAAWRSAGALDGVDWSAVRVLSSTGEASNPEDSRWLMERVGAPIIEYCGGTEIGGGYITGSVLQPAFPSQFTMPALGLDLRILDETGGPTDLGELFIVPPSIGLSTEVLNRDHDEVYSAGLPEADVPLRRHGDQMERTPEGGYRAHGRTDDTMNLGGIKVSSADLERVVGTIEGVAETAAIAVAPQEGGPDRLVVYAVPASGSQADPDHWRVEMQHAIRTQLNPLFQLDEVVVIDELPRTASQKVMRRTLRARHER